ncbi:MAG: ABC transporter substrate-binding protein [Spirochaetes bacterium]|nr:ABC transporter substrate-binding protein [Spirochaetota bacterium]
MKTLKLRKAAKTAFLAIILFAVSGTAIAQQRLVLGGKAVIMVADAVYLFPDAGQRVIAVAGADQGLGVFLAVLDGSFAKKPVIDRSAGVEVYASLKPDAVIMKSSMKKSMGASLDALGIKQLYLNLETPEDYTADIKALGEFLGQKVRAAEIVSWYGEALADTAARVKKASRPRVLLVQAASPTEGVWEVPPVSWMQTRLVEMAGGVPVWGGANPGSGWAKINVEQIAAWNPDAVFVVDYHDNARDSARIFASDARLSHLSAVKKGLVFGFAQDFYSWDQPDTRWILGLEWMAGKLHPELFADRPILESARGFFRAMYGMDTAVFDATIEPRLGDLTR